MQTRYHHHHIGGTWIEGRGEPLLSFDPATAELIWEGKHAIKEEVVTALQAARAAQNSWRFLPLPQREQFLQAFATRLKRRQSLLAQSISCETGKPLWESLLEVHTMIHKVQVTIDAYAKRSGESYRQYDQLRQCLRHKPVGVVTVFSPFNFPGLIAHGHILPALLAGNTVVWKPSPYTPMSCAHIMECWDQVDLLPGVLNLVQGGSSTADHFLQNSPLFDGLLFTGTTESGRAIARQFAQDPHKMLVLEMGGNNPLIVWEPDNPCQAAYIALLSTFLSSGQRCNCARRIIVSDDEKGELFLKAFITMARSIVTAPYFQRPEPFMGPVISYEKAQHLLQKQQSLMERGGKSLLAMELLRPSTGLVCPGIVDMSCAKRVDEEIFGPLAQIIRAASFQGAVDEANQTRFGLAAGLICPSIKHYRYFYGHIEAGLLSWNHPMTGACSLAPFGGIKSSGNYRPAAYYAADYCSYPVASMEGESLSMPPTALPGISLSFLQNENL